MEVCWKIVGRSLEDGRESCDWVEDSGEFVWKNIAGHVIEWKIVEDVAWKNRMSQVIRMENVCVCACVCVCV